jgi:tryptophan synthase alpha chain
MSAIDQLFDELRSNGKKAFMPFVTAGDPDLEFTKEVIQLLSDKGCNLCEIGIPYSDPIADGPVIQASYTRALDRGLRIDQIFEATRQLAPEIQMPMVTMVSYAIVLRHGLEQFVDDAQKARIAGAIVPDLLVDESSELAAICKDRDFSLIQLVTPTTPRERAVRIAESSTGFLYYVSVTGITGERRDLPAELVDTVGWLKEQTNLPICIGFGISQPEQISRLAPVADGMIVGSAIVRIMEKAEANGRDATLNELGQFVEQLISALG